MGTETGWTEKAKADWAKFRAYYEADIPDAFLKPEEIAKIREHRACATEPFGGIEGWKRYMDIVEKKYASMPDSMLIERHRHAWLMINWAIFPRREDEIEWISTLAVMASRDYCGYDPKELHNRWHAEEVAKLKADLDAMVSEGEPLASAVRELVAQATDKETGEVNWVCVCHGLVMSDWNGIDDATRARHGLGTWPA